MNKENQNQLFYLLQEFFATHDLNARDFLNKNAIAALLKNELSKKNRWKNLSRGKPNRFRIN
jgi:hypothetical protein